MPETTYKQRVDTNFLSAVRKAWNLANIIFVPELRGAGGKRTPVTKAMKVMNNGNSDASKKYYTHIQGLYWNQYKEHPQAPLRV
jgi:hypothetical protein